MDKTNILGAFSQEQVSCLTGLSQAQLSDWDCSGFFVPAFAYENRRSPFSRIYSFEDVVGLRTLALLRKQVSMQHLRDVATQLKAHSGKPWSEITLYILNREVHFMNPKSRKIEGAVSGQYGATIPLKAVAAEMRDKTKQMRKRKPETIGKIDKRRFVMGGANVIAGTRIPVSSIRSFADAGYSVAAIIDEYPSLTKEDVEAALVHSSLTLAA